MGRGGEVRVEKKDGGGFINSGLTVPPAWLRALLLWLFFGNSIRLPGAYAPSTKKSYFEMSKNLDKKFYMCISIIYVRSSSFTKNQYFVWSI